MQIDIGNTFTPRNAIIAVVIIVLLALCYFINWAKVDTVTAKVTDTETVRHTSTTRTSSGRRRRSTSYKKLIYTDKGTFGDSSDFLRGKTGSMYYNSVEEGGTYIFTTSGYNLGMLNIYPNIIEMKPVTSPSQESSDYNTQ